MRHAHIARQPRGGRMPRCCTSPAELLSMAASASKKDDLAWELFFARFFTRGSGATVCPPCIWGLQPPFALPMTGSSSLESGK